MYVFDELLDRLQVFPNRQSDCLAREPFSFEAVVNPTWRALSNRMEIATEGCLSIPDIKVDVPRFWENEVEAWTPEGEVRRWGDTDDDGGRGRPEPSPRRRLRFVVGLLFGFG